MTLIRRRTASSQRIIERLRRICLALPEATEKEAWSEPTWRVKGKMFAQLDDRAAPPRKPARQRKRARRL